MSEHLHLQGYNFYSVLVDKRAVPFHGEVDFYATGWANDQNFDVNGFFVARGKVNISSSVPTIEVMWDRDVSSSFLRVRARANVVTYNPEQLLRHLQ